jgi:acetate kinase
MSIQQRSELSSRIVVANAGAATFKLAEFDVRAKDAVEKQRLSLSWNEVADFENAIDAALDALNEPPDAFGHRIVHGGRRFQQPVRIDDNVENALAELAPLAPLHSGPALLAIRRARQRFPEVPAVAVFDTAFHADRPAASLHYALPSDIAEKFEIRRYGFHGIAHSALIRALADEQGIEQAEATAVTLQLGAGCSACAIDAGRSIETSMGFTPLEGLVMVTRSGDIDPAIVFSLLRAGWEPDAIEDLLTRQSGLAGLSGLPDVRDIVAAAASGNPRAKLAIDIFVHRIVCTVGAYLTLLQGRGALVFGGGIGTNSADIRARVARGLAVWDVHLDSERNRSGTQGRIATSDSRPVYVFPTDEERVIARIAARLI